MEMSAEPHFIDKLISYFGKKLFVIIMPFEALGGVQVGDIAVCWSILIGAGMGYNIVHFPAILFEIEFCFIFDHFLRLIGDKLYAKNI